MRRDLSEVTLRFLRPWILLTPLDKKSFSRPSSSSHPSFHLYSILRSHPFSLSQRSTNECEQLRLTKHIQWLQFSVLDHNQSQRITTINSSNWIASSRQNQVAHPTQIRLKWSLHLPSKIASVLPHLEGIVLNSGRTLYFRGNLIFKAHSSWTNCTS